MSSFCGSTGAECPSEAVRRVLLVFSTVLHSVAVVVTCLRLWIRVHMRRFWWEDAWVALALCFDVVSAVSTWILTSPEGDHPWYTSRQPRIVATWLTLFSYTCLVWAVRMSIVFSLIRMVPRSGPMRSVRSIAGGCAALFLISWALCTASKAYSCGSNRPWYSDPHFQCPIGLPTAMIEFTTDVVSDIILVTLPAWILWRTKLHRNERMLVLSIFSMSLLSVTVSVVHVVFLIPVPGFMASTTANIEGALDLATCNLLVLVASVYRFCRRRNGEEDSVESLEDASGFWAKTSTSRSLRTTVVETLTTVDLERFETVSVYSTRSAPTPRSAVVPVRDRSLRSSFDVASLVL